MVNIWVNARQFFLISNIFKRQLAIQSKNSDCTFWVSFKTYVGDITWVYNTWEKQIAK